MNGYFERLGEELRLATELQYAPREAPESAAIAAGRLARARESVRRFVRGRVGRWPTLGVLAVVVVSGSAAAAAIPLLGGSHGLAGPVPQEALSAPGRLLGPAGAVVPHRLPNGLRYAIPVTPDLEAGDTGWCAYPAFELAGSHKLLSPGAGACAPASVGSVAIVGGGEPLTNVLDSLPSARAARPTGALPSNARLDQALRHAAFLNWVVVSDRVAAVKLGATSFVPLPDPELAAGWRAVAVFTRGPASGFRLFDRHGQAINQHGSQPVSPVPVTTVNPSRLPPAVCALGPSTLAGLGTEWEVVANAAPSRGPVVDPVVLFSCARAWYAFPRSHAVYSAAILLDAQNPARRAPALPGLTPSIRPGDYEEAAGTAGQTTARRIGNAWLLVQGPRQLLREALLHNISAAGTAIHR
jgi:hypothetical protein